MKDKIKLIRVLIETNKFVLKETIMSYFDISEASFNRIIQAYRKNYGKNSLKYDRKLKAYIKG